MEPEPEMLQLRNLAKSAREAGAKAEKVIKAALEGTPEIERLAYSITSRTKGEYRIVDKVLEMRRQGLQYYIPLHLQDICGFRIITLFHVYIIEVLDFILGLISHKSQYGRSPKDKLELNNSVF